MTCPTCQSETSDGVSFCPFCGEWIGPSPPAEGGEAYSHAPYLRQSQLPLTGVPSPGPLLTGRVAIDAALGFLGEIVAVALVIYATWSFIQLLAAGRTPALYCFVEMAGILVTALVVYTQTDAMRKRYPTFSRGWLLGRNTWGKGMEHLITLVLGILMLCVLFPLGGLLLCLSVSIGPLGWILGLSVAYLFGILVRRMSIGNKKSGTTP